MDKSEKSPEKIFALADCNAFFCSCEQLFRPDLRGKPVGVLSNNDGCFVSRTKELKALGVPMGAPYFKYRDVCEFNRVAVFSSNFSLYTDISKRVMNTLKTFSDGIEIYSVDEAFLDLTTFQRQNLYQYGKKIKETVARHIGIPISIGIASTRTLSKIANHWAKKKSLHGVCYLPTHSELTDAILEKVPVEDIWGVGRRNTVKLHALGIKTARDFRDYDNEKLIQKIFHKPGRQTQDELRGIPCIELIPEEKKKDSILCSRTFAHSTDSMEDVKRSVANYLSYATEKLRSQDSLTKAFDVYYRTDPFKAEERFIRKEFSVGLASGSSFTPELIQYAWDILDTDETAGINYRKAGVMLHHFEDRHARQLGLFEQQQDPLLEKRKEDLMNVMDQINQRFGKNSLKSLACGTEGKERWKMKRNQKSPAYTTEWNELYSVE